MQIAASEPWVLGKAFIARNSTTRARSYRGAVHDDIRRSGSATLTSLSSSFSRDPTPSHNAFISASATSVGGDRPPTRGHLPWMIALQYRGLISSATSARRNGQGCFATI